MQPPMKHRTAARIVTGLLLVLSSIPAFADSTTGTTLAIEGKPIPGTQVTAHVVVTGKHLVTGPGRTVFGGDVQVSVNGTLVAQVQATYPFNSSLDDSGCVQTDAYQNCIRTKYISRNTDVRIPISLPKGVSAYQIVASYTGDTDSHGSSSAPVVLKPLYPSAASAAITFLLD